MNVQMNITITPANKLINWEVPTIVIFILGTIGNVLSILVMRSKSMRGSNAAVFVVLISVTDTVYLFLRNVGYYYKNTGIYHEDTECFFNRTITIAAEVT